jgi:hypothetical protein
MADRDTNGAVLYYGDGADPEVFTALAGLVEVATPFGASRPAIDTTESPSVARTFRGGRPDFGSLTCTIKFDHEVTSHGTVTGLLQQLKTRGPVNWSLGQAASSADSAVAQYMAFSGVVTAVDVSAADDDVFRASVTIKHSGEPTYGTVAPATS